MVSAEGAAMLAPERGAIPPAQFALIPSCPGWKCFGEGEFFTPFVFQEEWGLLLPVLVSFFFLNKTHF